MKIEKIQFDNKWIVYHEQFATDHFEIEQTIIEAETPEKALKIFNKNLADDHYIKQAKLEDVCKLNYYKEK